MRNKVGWILVDERWGTWEFYFLCVCACLRRRSTWNCEWLRSRPDTTVLIRLVCLDRQLFLRAAPTEGTFREGEHTGPPHFVISLTGVLGRVSRDLHLNPGRFYGRVFGQHL